jgi:hypothetical protein
MIWTREEKQFLIENYFDRTSREIAKKLGRTNDAVKHKRVKLGLKKGPKYRWRRENVIDRFQKLRTELDKTPTYKECLEYAPGMLMSIHNIWGKYSTFLKTQHLDIHIRYWTKRDCIEEFNNLKSILSKIPTQKELARCSGLFRAITRRWNTYNNFLSEFGYKPNFEIKWNKETCKLEFKKLMKTRKHIPNIEEFQAINMSLANAIYNHFGRYSLFLISNGYSYSPILWLDWEDLVGKICTKLFSKVLIKPRLGNNKLPDIAILKDNKIKKIIDAKLSSFNYSIYKDISNYSEYCDELEFWCAYGNKCLKTKKAKIRTIKDIKQLLCDKNELKLLEEIKRFEQCLAK